VVRCGEAATLYGPVVRASVRRERDRGTGRNRTNCRTKAYTIRERRSISQWLVVSELGRVVQGPNLAKAMGEGGLKKETWARRGRQVFQRAFRQAAVKAGQGMADDWER
jgi:hypothetical protein